jgi:hypothetical protein
MVKGKAFLTITLKRLGSKIQESYLMLVKVKTLFQLFTLLILQEWLKRSMKLSPKNSIFSLLITQEDPPKRSLYKLFQVELVLG